MKTKNCAALSVYISFIIPLTIPQLNSAPQLYIFDYTAVCRHPFHNAKHISPMAERCLKC